MPSNSRFGRRIAVPSTRQIRHELLAMELKELQLAEKAGAAAPPPVTQLPLT